MSSTKEAFIKQANTIAKNTLLETLNIEFVDYGEDFVIAKMPVNSRVHQPDGVLHGGATVALAETTGSFAALALLNRKDTVVRGLEISANHVKSISEGYIFAKATFVHKGRTTQILDIRITDESGALISLCKLTTITLPKSK